MIYQYGLAGGRKTFIVKFRVCISSAMRIGTSHRCSWPRRDAESYLRFMSLMFRAAAGVVLGTFVAFCVWFLIILIQH